jgi:hypothetical protein
VHTDAHTVGIKDLNFEWDTSQQPMTSLHTCPSSNEEGDNSLTKPADRLWIQASSTNRWPAIQKPAEGLGESKLKGRPLCVETGGAVPLLEAEPLRPRNCNGAVRVNLLSITICPNGFSPQTLPLWAARASCAFSFGALIIVVQDITIYVLVEHVHFCRGKLACADSALEKHVQLGKRTP